MKKILHPLLVLLCMISGQELAGFVLEPGLNRAGLSNLEQGLYLLRVKSMGKHQSSKFLKHQALKFV